MLQDETPAKTDEETSLFAQKTSTRTAKIEEDFHDMFVADDVQR